MLGCLACLGLRAWAGADCTINHFSEPQGPVVGHEMFGVRDVCFVVVSFEVHAASSEAESQS